MLWKVKACGSMWGGDGIWQREERDIHQGDKMNPCFPTKSQQCSQSFVNKWALHLGSLSSFWLCPTWLPQHTLDAHANCLLCVCVCLCVSERLVIECWGMFLHVKSVRGSAKIGSFRHICNICLKYSVWGVYCPIKLSKPLFVKMSPLELI